MTAEIQLYRPDTGEFPPVRIVDGHTDDVSAPYSRAIGILDKWVAAERRAVDEFSAWIEGETARAKAEMRALGDELRLPVAWAEHPVTVLFDKDNPNDRIGLGMGPALRARYGTVGGQSPFVARRPTDVLGELYEERRPKVLAGPAADETMPGITPRPRGPRARYAQVADGWLQRVEAWARRRFTPVKEEQ